MKRRTVLIGSSLGIGAAVAGYTLSGSNVLKPSWLKSLEWNEDNRLAVTFESDHEIDGVAIRHSDHTAVDDDLVVRGTPEFSGPIYIDLQSKIHSHGGPFPNRTFKIVGYIGAISDDRGPNIINKEKGKYDFETPENVVSSDYFQ